MPYSERVKIRVAVLAIAAVAGGGIVLVGLREADPVAERPAGLRPPFSPHAALSDGSIPPGAAELERAVAALRRVPGAVVTPQEVTRSEAARAAAFSAALASSRRRRGESDEAYARRIVEGAETARRDAAMHLGDLCARFARVSGATDGEAAQIHETAMNERQALDREIAALVLERPPSRADHQRQVEKLLERVRQTERLILDRLPTDLRPAFSGSILEQIIHLLLHDAVERARGLKRGFVLPPAPPATRNLE